jgi:hypothetical protein
MWVAGRPRNTPRGATSIPTRLHTKLRRGATFDQAVGDLPLTGSHYVIQRRAAADRATRGFDVRACSYQDLEHLDVADARNPVQRRLGRAPSRRTLDRHQGGDNGCTVRKVARPVPSQSATASAISRPHRLLPRPKLGGHWPIRNIARADRRVQAPASEHRCVAST